jgi:hypothetical protein
LLLSFVSGDRIKLIFTISVADPAPFFDEIFLHYLQNPFYVIFMKLATLKTYSWNRKQQEQIMFTSSTTLFTVDIAKQYQLNNDGQTDLMKIVKYFLTARLWYGGEWSADQQQWEWGREQRGQLYASVMDPKLFFWGS